MPFNSIFSWLIKKRIHQIDLFKKYPIEVQNEVFTKLISSAMYTEFGFQNNFFRIKDQKTCYSKKDAVQVRVMYSNGNILKATSKFDVFNTWCELINFQQKHPEIDSENFSSLFEQAAEVWKQHPAPTFEAIVPWATAFCSRRDALSNNDDLQEDFRNNLVNLLAALWLTSQHNSDQEEMNKQRDREMQNWLKLAAFILRKRDIKIKN